MLKTLKWVYDLGVRQERVRVAAHLNTRRSALRNSIDYRRAMLEDSKKKMAASRKEKLHQSILLDETISSIIGDILDPNWEQTMTNSLMFPDDKHKGEM